MSKNLNVNLSFTANTAQAKAQIKSLQDSLSSLSMNHVGDINIDDKLRKANAEAAQLKAHLAAATNMKTGALDFTKLNRSLKDSGVSLQHYGETLRAMGPEGQRAFSQLARAVAQSEVPIRRTNKLVKEMSTTLKNSLRWQLSSSILHGFMTSMQDAYNYAKNLNSSLTDIRIVSGQSADQMARFAKQANIAAKDLSTTTNEYAKAALIYYQQGLKQQEVLERTEVTVKMANVTGDAEQDVSSYMTAIWNNFNKAGDESVEHFADIMTKLGAATAASTSEIAAGLSKFSAVADTIGLSFEMATSAVTAIVDQTRETPEVVGTALKTIFSRIEGLQQGETMEDGVNLNKYSKGLQKVGVDIMDTNGKLKDADQILKEIGNKWETLDKNQQVALAQTTAGIRQYNQFMALFDNWDKVEQNLTLAATAEGTLDQQADIYAESWEAASKRVRASLEGLFDSLLEDDFFIGLLNGFSELIGFIEGAVDALGGMKGVLLAIGAVLTNVFGKQMAGGLRNMAENIQMMTPKGRQKVIDQKAAFLKNAAESGFDENAGYGSKESQARRNSIQGQVELQNLFLENEGRMNDIERSSAQTLLDNYSAQSERVAEAAGQVDTSRKTTQDMKYEMFGEGIDNARKAGMKDSEATDAINKATSQAKSDLSKLSEYDQILEDINKNGSVTEDQVKRLNEITSEVDQKQKDGSYYHNLAKDIPEVGDSAEVATAKMKKLGDKTKEVAGFKFDENTQKFLSGKGDRVDNYIDSIHQQMRAEEDLSKKQKDEAEKRKQVQDQINNAQGVKATAADGIISIANAAANAMMVVTMLSGAIATLKNPDASGWDKFLAIIGALGVAIPVLTSSFTMLASAEGVAAVAALKNAIAQKLEGDASSESGDQAEKDANQTKKQAASSNEAAAAAAKNGLIRGTNGSPMKVKKGKIKTPETKVKKLPVPDDLLPTQGLKAYGKEVADIGKILLNVVKVHPVITAAVLATAAAIWIGVKAWNADADAAKKAAKAAQDASKAHEQAVQKQEEMDSALASYEEANESLKTLTRGTYEWTKAVNTCNQAVLQLLEEFPLLAQYIENIDGKLVISEVGKDIIEQQMTDEVNAAYNNALLANVRAGEAQLKSDITDTRREIRTQGSSATGTRANISEDMMEQVLQRTQEIGTGFLANPELIAKEFSNASKATVEALYTNADQIIELSAQMSANTAANELAAQQIGHNALAQNKDYLALSEEQQKAASQAYGEEFLKGSQDLYDHKYQTMLDAKVQEQYAELLGAEATKNKGGGVGEYLIDGQWQTFSDETARWALAQAEAATHTDTFATKVIEAANALAGLIGVIKDNNEYTDRQSELLGKIMSGEEIPINTLTGEDIEFLKNLNTKDFKDQGIDWTEDTIFKNEEDFLEEVNSIGTDAEDMRFTENASLAESFAKGYLGEQYTDAVNSFSAGKGEEFFGNRYVPGGVQAQNTYAENNSVDLPTDTVNLAQDVLADLNLQDRENGNLLTTEDLMGLAQGLIAAQEEGIVGTTEEEERAYLSEGAEELQTVKEQELKITTEGFDVEEINQLAEHIMDSEGIDDPLRAREMALNMRKSEQAAESLNGVMEEHGDILKDLKKRSEFTEDYQDSLNVLKKTMADITDLSEEAFTDEMLEEAIDLGAFEGNIEAYEDLLIEAFQRDGKFDDIEINPKLGIDQTDIDNIGTSLDTLTDLAPDIDMEVDANTDPAIASLMAMAATSAETQAALDALGYEPIVELAEGETSNEESGFDVQTTWTAGSETFDAVVKGPLLKGEAGSVTVPVPNANMTVTKSPSEKSTDKKTVMGWHNANKPGAKIVGLKRTRLPSGSGGKGGSSGGGGGGGGGGGKGSRIKKSPKSSNQKRYEKVTNRLQDLARAQKNAADEADRLYGEERLKNMDKVSEKIKEQIKLLEETKLAEIKAYKNQDEQALKKEIDFLKGIYGNDLIPNLEIDENGNISNIEDYFNFLATEIQKIDELYGNEDIISEADQEKKTLLEERKARLEAVYEPYKETVQLEEDTLDEIKDFERELQDIAFENINYKLEFEIELNEAELEKIDYFFNKTQKDNIYDMAEGLMIYGNRWEQLADSAEHYRNTYNELQKSFENGEISKDQLIKGQKEAISNLIENAEQMQEFLEYATHEYYAEALEMGIEEIDKYAEGFDRLSDAVDHYMNIASTLGKETDYEYIEKFLNANISNINNKLDASTEKYNMLVEQRNYWEEQLGKYEYGSTEYEQVKKNLEATNEAVEEAYDERLSIVEEKAEAIRALIENKMAQAAKSLENALTDGSGFDSLMDGFEKLNSRQEEYLTKTNQIYETNKLMRQAAQAADKTDNEVAKRKLKNFEDETKSLQQNTKLSNYELEIQQAKYDLLLAEIALEEAQNAKSTVRLQRDNEGNFGYVYTANKDEIADAQQQYEDAQNALYNISLQGQQDYTAKYLESLQMMQEELTELDQRWLEGEIATQEEYNRQREAITDHYFNPDYGVLSTYSKLYNVAVQTDAKATEDYWGKSYGNMTTRTEDWKTAVNNYVAEVKDAFGLWTSAQIELNNDLNGTLKDNAKFTEDVKNKSKDLADTITTTVIPAVEEEIESVKALTQEWINDIKAMEEVIAKSEEIFKLKNKENKEEGKEKTWDSYGKDFDFMREAIRIGLGKGTTDMKSVDEALAYREQKLLDNVNNKELLDLAGLGQYLGDEEGLRTAVGIQHDNVRNSIARAGYDRSTSSYLNSIADDSSKGYSYKDIYEKYTDLSVDMLLLASKDEKYKNYASYGTYEEAADQRRAKVEQLGLGDWNWKRLEILFERANHEPKLAAYLETLRQKVINGTYPDIKPEIEAGIPWDLSAAINQYIQSGGKSDSLGYIKSSADLQMALDSRKNTISAERIKDLKIASNEKTFNESELKKYGAHFDTGGYTGSWGPEGKLAMLHQKELILNASDTENMLKMIEIVRDLSQQIDMFAASQALRGALFSSPSYLTGQNGTLEQNVHIEASFPGVTDRNQIEEAFGDLINVAYQYAHRK